MSQNDCRCRASSRDWSREPTVGELGLCEPPQLTWADYDWEDGEDEKILDTTVPPEVE